MTLSENLECHPYNSIDAGISAKLLIMGTAPPNRFSKQRKTEPKKGDIDFYYGSRHNNLWRHILPALFSREFLDKDAIIDFLRCKSIWFTDILEQYSRLKDNANDENLKSNKDTSLIRLFDNHQEIHTIILTGGATEAYFRRKLEEERLIEPYKFNDGTAKMKLPRKRTITISGRARIVYTVPSPSRRSVRQISLDRQIEMYREAFASVL